MTKVIHLLIAQHQEELTSCILENQNNINNNRNAETSQISSVTTTTEGIPNNIGESSNTRTLVRRHKCYAIKCRLLQAAGVIRKTMLCSIGKTICSGCYIETSKHRRVKQLENEILHLLADNNTLSPLVQAKTHSISIQQFRKILECLPTFANKSRDDIIFGAAKYVANTIGVKITQGHKTSTFALDESLSITAVNELWRQAAFFCRCSESNPITYGIRCFCQSCSYLIRRVPDPCNICPSCNIYESWERSDAPCLSCQLASIVYRNPFEERFDILVNTWLPTGEFSESGSEDSQQNITHDELFHLRCSFLDESIASIKAKSSHAQNQSVFKELTNLKTTLRKSKVSAPSSTGLQSNSIDILSQQSHNTTQTRIPLAAIDMNVNHNDKNHIEENACSYTSESTKKDRKRWRAPGTSNQMRNHARTIQKRALKKSKP